MTKNYRHSEQFPSSPCRVEGKDKRVGRGDFTEPTGKHPSEDALRKTVARRKEMLSKNSTLCSEIHKEQSQSPEDFFSAFDDDDELSEGVKQDNFLTTDTD